MWWNLSMTMDIDKVYIFMVRDLDIIKDSHRGKRGAQKC